MKYYCDQEHTQGVSEKPFGFYTLLETLKTLKFPESGFYYGTGHILYFIYLLLLGRQPC